MKKIDKRKVKIIGEVTKKIIDIIIIIVTRR